MTDSLLRRSSEHVKEYQENIENSKLRLMFFNYIDEKQASHAERELKDYLSDDMLKFKKYKELAILNPKHKKFLKSHFSYINENFSGKLKLVNLQFENQIEKIKQNQIEKIKLGKNY